MATDILGRAIRQASFALGADEIIKIANDIVRYPSWYADPFRSQGPGGYDGVRPLTHREITDAMIAGKVMTKRARGFPRAVCSREEATSLLRHAMSLESDLTISQVQGVINEIIVEVIMEI